MQRSLLSTYMIARFLWCAQQATVVSLKRQKAEDNIYFCEFLNKILSLIYHLENSKTRGQTG